MQFVFYPTTLISDSSVTIHVTSNPHENIPNLRNFRVNAIGMMRVTTHMIRIAGVEEDIVPPIEERIISTAKTNLLKVLTGRFKDALSYSIYKTPLDFSI